MVNGTIQDLVANLNAQLGTPLTPDEITELRREQERLARTSSCLSDPAGMLEDALGRFEEVPDRESTKKRARDLIRNNQVEDARFRVDDDPNLDIVIVCHPDPQVIKGVDDEDILVDRYLVFGRENMGTKRGNCYTCNNASRKGTRPLPHDCWRKRTWEDWEPMVFAWAHGIDDAEDLAKELRSSWQATAEQRYDDNALINHSRLADEARFGHRSELPFSNDYQAGFLAAKPNAWSTLAEDRQWSPADEGFVMGQGDD